MFRIFTTLLIVSVLFLSGCSSVESYQAHLRTTQALIEETAIYSYDICMQNQMKAIESAVLTQTTGKLFITPDLVDQATKDELESRWMQLEMQMTTISSPPTECVTAHETIKFMHGACQKLYQMALAPAGPVEQYQFTTDVLYQSVVAKGSELTKAFAEN